MNSSLGSRGPANVLAFLLVVVALVCGYAAQVTGSMAAMGVAVLLLVAALLTPLSLKMAQQWEKAVVLRFGKLHAVRGPGLFLMVPVADSVTAWVDQRIQTTEFSAEQALTRDTVPANIDAILFWQVHDAERAALEITDRIDVTRMPELLQSVRASVSRSAEVLEQLVWHSTRTSKHEP